MTARLYPTRYTAANQASGRDRPESVTAVGQGRGPSNARSNLDSRRARPRDHPIHRLRAEALLRGLLIPRHIWLRRGFRTQRVDGDIPRRHFRLQAGQPSRLGHHRHRPSLPRQQFTHLAGYHGVVDDHCDALTRAPDNRHLRPVIIIPMRKNPAQRRQLGLVVCVVLRRR